MKTVNQIARQAAEAIQDAYWTACDAKGAAIDPADLTGEAWAIELLAEAYHVALQIEADPLGWSEGRQKW